MRAQVFNDYFKMQSEGLVPQINCIDKSHGRLFVSLPDDDTIELFCLACNFKVRPGILMYERMINYMAVHDLAYLKELKHG